MLCNCSSKDPEKECSYVQIEDFKQDYLQSSRQDFFRLNTQCWLVTTVLSLAVVATSIAMVLMLSHQMSNNMENHLNNVLKTLKAIDGDGSFGNEPLSQLLQIHQTLLSAYMEKTGDTSRLVSNDDFGTKTDTTATSSSSGANNYAPGIVPGSSCSAGFARDYLGKCRPVMRPGRKR